MFKYKLILLSILNFITLYGTYKPSILIVYNVPLKVPYINWNDGFVAAVRLLEGKYNIKWCTLDKIKNKQINCNNFDIIFIKSSWNTECETYMRNIIPQNKLKALLISNTNKPRNDKDLHFYDVLFYETNWYRQFIRSHPRCIHAFGINTEIMSPPATPTKKIYDYIMVCDFKYKTKRHLKFISKPGNKKLAIGSIDLSNGNAIKNKLEKAGIKVIDSVEPKELAKLYHQSHKAYLPCTIHGGGDRSVLEARSCGIPVEIEPDNPKLKELLNGPIYNHFYYSKQLEKGIKFLLKKKKTKS